MPAITGVLPHLPSGQALLTAFDALPVDTQARLAARAAAAAPEVPAALQAAVALRWAQVPRAARQGVLERGVAYVQGLLDSGMEREADPQALAGLAFLESFDEEQRAEARVWRALAAGAAADDTLLREAAASPALPPTLRWLCAQRRVRRAVQSGHRLDALACFAWARALLPDDALLPWAQVLANMALFYGWEGDTTASLALSAEAMQRTAHDHGHARVMALWVRALLLTGAGFLDRSAPLEAEGIALARAARRPHLEVAIRSVTVGRLMELKAWEEARAQLDDALATCAAEGMIVRRIEALLSAGILAILTDPAAAPPLFEAALALNRPPWTAQAPQVRLQRSFAWIALGRFDAAEDDLTAAAIGLTSAAGAWVEVGRALAAAEQRGQWTAAEQATVLAIPTNTAVSRALKRWIVERAGLSVARARPDGSRVVLPSPPTVHDLSTRPALQRLVNALATSARPLSRDALIAAGWPDERIHPEAARNRLDVALSALRKLGLRDALTVEDDHYRLTLLLDACC